MDDNSKLVRGHWRVDEKTGELVSRDVEEESPPEPIKPKPLLHTGQYL